MFGSQWSQQATRDAILRAWRETVGKRRGWRRRRHARCERAHVGDKCANIVLFGLWHDARIHEAERVVERHKEKVGENEDDVRPAGNRVQFRLKVGQNARKVDKRREHVEAGENADPHRALVRRCARKHVLDAIAQQQLRAKDHRPRHVERLSDPEQSRVQNADHAEHKPERRRARRHDGARKLLRVHGGGAQRRRTLLGALFHGPALCRLAVAVDSLDVAALGHQVLDNVRVLLDCGPVQRSAAAFVGNVDSSTLLQYERTKDGGFVILLVLMVLVGGSGWVGG